MTRFALILALGLSASSASAEDSDTGMTLMERGAQMFLDGLLREMEPALEGFENLGPALRGFADEMGPALAEILGKVEDWSSYHPPEILPNGDIIIRKKDPSEAPVAPEAPIDL